MSTPAVADLNKLPGSERDPNPVWTGFWFLLLALFLITLTFALTYLVLAVTTKAQHGEKATGHDSALETLNARQDEELKATVNADKLYLENGEVVEGIVVDYTDEKGLRHIVVRGVRYELQRREHAKRGVKPDLSVGKPIKDIDYSPDEVMRVERGRGGRIAVPIGQALKLYLQDLGTAR